MIECKRCNAKTRKGGKCKSPAMKNGRCRMHGGLSTGAPKGNQNARKHGFYSAEMISYKEAMRELLRDSRRVARDMDIFY